MTLSKAAQENKKFVQDAIKDAKPMQAAGVDKEATIQAYTIPISTSHYRKY